jgi:hypothetical protein
MVSNVHGEAPGSVAFATPLKRSLASRRARSYISSKDNSSSVTKLGRILQQIVYLVAFVVDGAPPAIGFAAGVIFAISVNGRAGFEAAFSIRAFRQRPCLRVPRLAPPNPANNVDEHGAHWLDRQAMLENRHRDFLLVTYFSGPRGPYAWWKPQRQFSALKLGRLVTAGLNLRQSRRSRGLPICSFRAS